MLSEAELRTLVHLHDEQSVSALATTLDRTLQYTSELVTRLEETGLVDTRKQGQTRFVSPSESKVIELLHDLTQRHSHVDWPGLLAGATLEVLYYLDVPRSVSELDDHTPVHRSTISRRLGPLERRGIVYQTDSGTYALNEEFELLSQFARELAHHRHRITIDPYTAIYTILWESVDECLLQTPDEIDQPNFHPTGPDQFQAYGLPLLARERRYYLYSESTSHISPAELCCHMLVIDDGTRTLSYCLLLLSHVDVDINELRAQAEKYEVSDSVEDLLTYLETHGEETTPTLPTWNEFESLAEEYEVTL
jgi:DNA-binding transcriptional ArsR family regulator